MDTLKMISKARENKFVILKKSAVDMNVIIYLKNINFISKHTIKT